MKKTSRKRAKPKPVDPLLLLDSFEPAWVGRLGNRVSALSDRIAELHERMRVMEGDIERMQKYIGRLSRVLSAPVLSEPGHG